MNRSLSGLTYRVQDRGIPGKTNGWAAVADGAAGIGGSSATGEPGPPRAAGDEAGEPPPLTFSFFLVIIA
jgi:hypothetical protein